MVTPNAQLVVHAGGFKTTRQELANFPTPEGTDTWKPVPHWLLVDLIHEELASRGLVVTREEYAIQPKRDMLVGILVLAWQETNEFAACLAVRQANNMTESIKIYAGVRVFACDNTSVSGDAIILKKKHTKNLVLRNEMPKAIDRYQQGVLQLTRSVDTLRDTKLTISQGHDSIVDIFRRKLVPVRLFHDVVEQWHRQEDTNLWSLHNCFTEPAQKLKPVPFMKSQVQLGTYFGLGKEGRITQSQEELDLIEAEFEEVE